MQQDITLRVTPQVAATAALLRRTAVDEAGLPADRVCGIRILRRSIDARQRQVLVNLTVRLYVDEPEPVLHYEPIQYPQVEDRPRVVVVGAGPGGLFAALRLIELGLCPVVLERGKDVHSRRKDIALISRQHVVDAESNYAFGEGGAGAYSDGKLYTRSTKRGNVDKILQVFCQHGASTDILVDAHPHIGTDRLPSVIEAMRGTILSHGGRVFFQQRVVELIRDARGAVCGVRTAQGGEYRGPVILATGHSARDVYRFLYAQHIPQEAKGLAVGVRLEHSAQLIDSIMYHSREGRGAFLPAAEYRMSAQVGGRGVYSFCMCPGGFVIPAASGPQQVVVDGMSPSGRNSRWSNSGMVVELRPEDGGEASLAAQMGMSMRDDDFAASHADAMQADHPLRMMYLQESLERACYQQAQATQAAPAQRMTDFVNGRMEAQLPESSYSPGLTASPLHFWMPRFLVERLQEGFRQFGRRYRSFLTREATVLAIETRTSSPVRIPRDAATLAHVAVPGLYPCGEGAGYAGGIVSAAIDGERCADAVAAALGMS